MKRQQDIQRILEDFRGVKNIPGIKSAKKRVLITNRKGIANVFGQFYKKYTTTMNEEESEQEIGENENESSIDVPRDHDRRVANCNQQTQKKGKSPESNGIRAEDIKACDDETVRQIYNEIS